MDGIHDLAAVGLVCTDNTDNTDEYRHGLFKLVFYAFLGLLLTPTVASGLVDSWIDLDEDTNYTARHECSFVQAGDRFYLFGGREQPERIDTYDYAADVWTQSAQAPIPFNHFQATTYEGLVWVIGAFQTNSFPNETPAESVYVYDPAYDVWMRGPDVPADRRRGSSGLVVWNERLYVLGGNTAGHNGGYVEWLDAFDPRTGQWTALADAPQARDHFHAAVIGDRLYAIGGRRSGGPGGTFAPLIPEIDVYDFLTEAWQTLPSQSDLPTPRAAASTAVFQDRILVIGGEGNGQAYETVEAFDPTTELWASLASLNHARHGTQAIASGEGVYVIAGSPEQGGGRQRNLEVYNLDQPSGVASIAGELVGPQSVRLASGLTGLVRLDHVAGNVGIYITKVELSGPNVDEFELIQTTAEPFLVGVEEQLSLLIRYSGFVDGHVASVDVTMSGGQFLSIPLVGAVASVQTGRFVPWVLIAGLLAIALVRIPSTIRG